MKRLLLFCCIILLAACQKEDYFRFTDSYVSGISLDEKGGNETLSYETNTDWMASSDADWIVISPKSGKAGTGSISVNVQPNTGYDARSGRITITAGAVTNYISVTQNEGKGIVAGKTSFKVGKEENTIEVKVQANVDYKVELLETAAEWISIISGPDTKGLSSSTVVLKVAENGTLDSRTGEIRLYGEDEETVISVVQFPKEFMELLTADEELTIPYIGDYKNTDVSFNIELTTNTEFKIEIQNESREWLSLSSISKVEKISGSVNRYSVKLLASKNYEWDRETELKIIQAGGETSSVIIKQEGIKPILMGLCYSSYRARQALETSGWGSDDPISSWGGIRIFSSKEGEEIEILISTFDIDGSLPASFGKLRNLSSLKLWGTYSGTIPSEWGNMRCRTLVLSSPNLTGPIPPEIGNIENLAYFDIHGEPAISSPLPAELGKLKKLEYLRMSKCSITGSIPSTFGDLESLKVCDLSDNKLSGELPASLGKLNNIEKIDLLNNQLTGSIPEEVLKANWWKNNIELIVCQQGHTIIPQKPYAQLRDITYPDLDNISHSLHELGKKNKYTILLRYSTICYWSTIFMPVILNLFERYKDKGLGVITLAYLGVNYRVDIPGYIDTNGMTGLTNLLVPADWNYDLYRTDFYGNSENGWCTPGIFVVDNDFNIVYGEGEDRNTLQGFIGKLFGDDGDDDEDTPPDYSTDGEVMTLQKASVGDGIKLVLMGDGFTDKDMGPGGKYEKRMNQAMEAFFSEEPVRSLRDRFDVYTVKAVSADEGIGEGKNTAFSTYFGDGSYIGGDNDRCFEYAKKVDSINSNENLTIVTVLNSDRYAGTCYFYTDGSSIAYCPYIYNTPESFNQVVRHESVGHGFGKLADEYVNNPEAAIPNDKLNNLLLWQSYGFYQNVDVTGDPDRILWASFLKNSRYAGQVGVYEGGYGYGKGVWRPTANSIMNQNEGGFNAPSRREIFKRALELSGETFTEEKFLEFDEKCLNTAHSQAPNKVAKLRTGFVPFAPPVLVK